MNKQAVELWAFWDYLEPQHFCLICLLIFGLLIEVSWTYTLCCLNFYSFWWCSYFRYPVLFLIEFLCILSLELFIHVFWGLESQKVENIRIHTYMVTLCSELALDFHTLNLVFLLDSSSFLYGHLLNIAKQSCFGFQSRNVFRFFLRSTHFFLGQFLR